MKSTGKSYNFLSSYDRIKKILDSSDNDYQESDSLPNRDKLTFNNGFYAYCSAMFVDIRGSSKLPNKYKRPRLAKLYRSYISELVAVMDGCDKCVEVNIVGDGVWGVFDTPYTSDMDAVFGIAANAWSMIKMLNYQLVKHGYDPIEVGIGLSYGRALVIKAGLSGSGINDIVYMGDVVNQAAKLAACGSKSYFDHPLMVSDVFKGNINEDDAKLLTWNHAHQCWHGDVVNSAMEDWYKENCT
ncbi:adenylate/guanylate cyclase domain-containing protein [Nocardia beijingensis]|uniref:adenylate/guanylate cyclase domain-containing protein n=1 Tax=Nocardia beijingensis TaxID=95162 RepID=UPI00344E8571